MHVDCITVFDRAERPAHGLRGCVHMHHLGRVLPSSVVGTLGEVDHAAWLISAWRAVGLMDLRWLYRPGTAALDRGTRRAHRGASRMAKRDQRRPYACRSRDARTSDRRRSRYSRYRCDMPRCSRRRLPERPIKVEATKLDPRRGSPNAQHPSSSNTVTTVLHSRRRTAYPRRIAHGDAVHMHHAGKVFAGDESPAKLRRRGRTRARPPIPW